MTTPNVHPAARELLLCAVDHGWSATLEHGIDTGENPCVIVTARRELSPYQVRVTWHTRKTGTYRLFSATAGRNLGTRDVTLTRAIEMLQS